MSGRIGAAIAGVVALGLLVGSATWTTVHTLAESANAIGESDGVLLGDPVSNHEINVAAQVMINDPWIGTKPTLSFERVAANCVRNEQSGTFTLQYLNGTPIDLLRTYDGWSCASERSWATWRITLKLADGTAASNRLEVRQTNSPGSGTFGMETLCWSEGNLACDGGHSTEIRGGYLSIYVGLVAIGPTGSKACAVEREICQVSGTHDVAYGFVGDYAIRRGASGPVECVAESFDRDPAPGVPKGCFIL